MEKCLLKPAYILSAWNLHVVFCACFRGFFFGWSNQGLWDPLKPKRQKIWGLKLQSYTERTHPVHETKICVSSGFYPRFYPRMAAPKKNNHTASLLEVHGGCLGTTIAWSVPRASSASKSSLLPLSSAVSNPLPAVMMIRGILIGVI